MKIMCLIKIICPLNTGIAPVPFVLSLKAWADNFRKHSEPYIFQKIDIKEDFHIWTQNTPYQTRTNYSVVLLFDTEEELNAWANNCRLTDPQLIADQEMWETAHGITFTYKYYSLSPTTGPDPIL